MGKQDTENKSTAKKRMNLGNPKAVRAALCKLAREYRNGEIADNKIRNLIYNLNSIIAADKYINVECELTNKFEQLEKLVNSAGGGTVIDSKELDSPYAQDLKKKLQSEQSINTELNNQLLELKRQIAGLKSIPTDSECVGG